MWRSPMRSATLAGEVHSQGVELAGAVRPIENLKLWGNVAFTQSQFGDFDIWTGNTVPNVAPVIINTGASYRFDSWRWPVEVGGSLRHVGQRFVSQDNLTAMLPYTTARSLCLCRHSRQGFVVARPGEDAGDDSGCAI